MSIFIDITNITDIIMYISRYILVYVKDIYRALWRL
jgi:hypothetical protein